jgi:hypothetical protein
VESAGKFFEMILILCFLKFEVFWCETHSAATRLQYSISKLACTNFVNSIQSGEEVTKKKINDLLVYKGTVTDRLVYWLIGRDFNVHLHYLRANHIMK